MATAAKPAIETFSFGGEAVGIAGASALRKVRSLAESAPPGRLFSSIATLVDTSAAAAKAYEAAGLADLQAETAATETQIGRGSRLAGMLKTALGAEAATPLPAFFRQK